MSATSTIHFACDGCGKRAEVEHVYANQRALPDGWQSTMLGDFCSEPCLFGALVERARKQARQVFTGEPMDAAHPMVTL